jgi:membrane protease YdiL (CAAX protease family)
MAVTVHVVFGYLQESFAVSAAQAAHPELPEPFLYSTQEFVDALLPWLALQQVALIAVVCVAIRRTMGADWRRKIGLRRPSLYHVVLAAVGIPGMLLTANLMRDLAAHVLPEVYDIRGMHQSLATWPWYFGVLVVGLAPGINEELWFRGFFGRGLIGRYGIAVGVLLTSAFFGLAHVDPRHAVATFTIGVYLHLAYLASGTIWIPILVHSLNNSLSILAMQYAAQASQSTPAVMEIPWTTYGGGVFLLAAVGWCFFTTRVRPVVQRKYVGDSSDVSADVAPAGARAGLMQWLMPFAAAYGCFQIAAAGTTGPKTVAPGYPAESEVREMLDQEPLTRDSWPVWSERFREWLSAPGENYDFAFDAAGAYLDPEFDFGAPEVPFRDDAVAWYLRGRSELKRVQNGFRVREMGRACETPLRRSVVLDATLGRAHHDLAKALFLQVDGAEATDPKRIEGVREAEMGEFLDPNAVAVAARAWAAMKQERFADAEQLYVEAALLLPDDPLLRAAAVEARRLRKKQAGGG